MSSCQGCHSETPEEIMARLEREKTLQQIKRKVVVLSGKGGVGKSTVAVNLAMALAMKGMRVGLLDVDIHGPSIPTMLHLTGKRLNVENDKLVPARYGNLKVMSIGFLLEQEDAPIIWRGPAKAGAIQQFVEEVDWGELDYLVVDCPPGTGDEPLSIIQILKPEGAVIVTTPQDVALADVRKSVSFCQQLALPIFGIVENMSGLVCPHCGETVEVFKTGGGRALAEKMGLPFLGAIPLDPQVVNTGDKGDPFVHSNPQSKTAEIFLSAVDLVIEQTQVSKGEKTMRIAIPLAEGKLTNHFGHCERFAFVNVDSETKKIVSVMDIVPPEHVPGLFPKWVHEQGAELVIAGGMGERAQALFAEQGVKVITGAPSEAPEALVTAYFSDTLVTGKNACDH